MEATTQEARKLLHDLRAQLDDTISEAVDNPAIINALPSGIRPWAQGAYIAGDVRTYGGNPYKCAQGHDSAGNPGWTPAATPALWMQYHGTSAETARPWIAPSGEHDMYRVGECMIWTDDVIYRCKQDTNFSPDEYAQAWEQA